MPEGPQGQSSLHFHPNSSVMAGLLASAEFPADDRGHQPLGPPSNPGKAGMH